MSHITDKQRYAISEMLKQGYTQIEIAKVIGKDKSVVSREINRNKDRRNGEYRYELAVRKSRMRQRYKSKPRKFTEEIKNYVTMGIKDDLSPEQIVGLAKKKGISCVSHERIYQFIWEDKRQKGELYLHLRRRGRRYRKRGSAKDNRGILSNRVTIDKRPEIVEQRKRFGDLEVDLIIGKNHKQAILTINDRASGMLKMKKVKSKDAGEVANAINESLEDWLPYLHTITSDNGKEFAKHKYVAETLNIDFYFALPYHPWERGSNENLNGLIRQYFPKGTDFEGIDDQRIKEIEMKLNSRPRKRFNFETPLEVMDNLLFNQEVAFCT